MTAFLQDSGNNIGEDANAALDFNGHDGVVDLQAPIGIDLGAEPFYVRWKLDGGTDRTFTICAQNLSNVEANRYFQMFNNQSGLWIRIQGDITQIDVNPYHHNKLYYLEIDPINETYTLEIEGEPTRTGSKPIGTRFEPTANFTIGGRHAGSQGVYSYQGDYKLYGLHIGTLDGSKTYEFDPNLSANTGTKLKTKNNTLEATLVDFPDNDDHWIKPTVNLGNKVGYRSTLFGASEAFIKDSISNTLELENATETEADIPPLSSIGKEGVRFGDSNLVVKAGTSEEESPSFTLLPEKGQALTTLSSVPATIRPRDWVFGLDSDPDVGAQVVIGENTTNINDEGKTILPKAGVYDYTFVDLQGGFGRLTKELVGRPLAATRHYTSATVLDIDPITLSGDFLVSMDVYALDNSTQNVIGQKPSTSFIALQSNGIVRVNIGVRFLVSNADAFKYGKLNRIEVIRRDGNAQLIVNGVLEQESNATDPVNIDRTGAFPNGTLPLSGFLGSVEIIDGDTWLVDCLLDKPYNQYAKVPNNADVILEGEFLQELGSSSPNVSIDGDTIVFNNNTGSVTAVTSGGGSVPDGKYLITGFAEIRNGVFSVIEVGGAQLKNFSVAQSGEFSILVNTSNGLGFTGQNVLAIADYTLSDVSIRAIPDAARTVEFSALPIDGSTSYEYTYNAATKTYESPDGIDLPLAFDTEVE